VFATSPVTGIGPVICDVKSVILKFLYINIPVPLLNKGKHSGTQNGIPVVVLVVLVELELVVVVVEELVLVVVLVELELVVVVVGSCVVVVVVVGCTVVLVVVVLLELVLVVVVLGAIVLVLVVVGFATIVISQGSSKQRSGSLHLLTHPTVKRITLLAII
jgi:hypothetical protein